MFLHYPLLFFSFFTFGTSEVNRQLPQSPLFDASAAKQDNEHFFSLHHIFHHGTHKHPTLYKHFSLLSSTESTLWLSSDLPNVLPQTEITRPLTAKSVPAQIKRVQNEIIESLIHHAQFGDPNIWSHPALKWSSDDVSSPNVTDKETILTLAYMSANAYEPSPESGSWTDVGSSFNESLGFGWEKEGVRGYVYVNEEESIVVISFKGGSARYWNPWDTAWADIRNVNLLFGCCCGQGSFLSHKSCSCARPGNEGKQCDVGCVADCLRGKDMYFRSALDIYSNVTKLYPDAQIWVAGHSLGGTMSSLLGHTYGIPAVTFETPGDALPISRLGLPFSSSDNKNEAIYHFGVSADPIFTGDCQGWTASCTFGGYSFDSRCHTGKRCVYDVRKDLGWRSSVLRHGIRGVIEGVIERYEGVPDCKEVVDCRDCEGWREV